LNRPLAGEQLKRSVALERLERAAVLSKRSDRAA
jgi:hypothetical protein